LDTFTYTIADGFGGTDTGSVRIVDELVTASVGLYRGLVIDGTQASVGIAEVRLSKKGRFTAQVWHLGERFRAKGQFDASGAAKLTVKGKGGSRPLTLQLEAETDQVSGSVQSGSSTNVVSLKRFTAKFGRGTPCPQAGPYTALLPVDPSHPGEDVYPQGCGYATMTVSSTGAVKASGKLGDDTAFVVRGAVDQDGVVLIHTPLYKAPKGFLCGAASFVTGDPGADQRGVLTWRKPVQQAGDSSYPGGFSGFTEWQAARFNRLAKGAPIFGPGVTTASVTMEYGGLADKVTKTVTIGASLLVQNTTPDTLTLSLNGKNGQFSGSYVHPGDSREHPVGGVLYQKLTIGRGTFTGIGDSGQALTGHWMLEPSTP
jgi:hypothetical protein